MSKMPTVFACCDPPLAGVGTLMQCSFAEEGPTCAHGTKGMYGNLWGDAKAHQRGWFEVGKQDGERIRFEDCDMTPFACDDFASGNCTTNNPHSGQDWAATCTTMKAYDKSGGLVSTSSGDQGYRIVHDRRNGQIYGTDIHQQLSTNVAPGYLIDVPVGGLIFAGNVPRQ